MKTLRHRIRIITLVMISALLMMILWTARSVWFPDGIVPETPAEPVSDAQPDPWAAPVPAGTGETLKLTDDPLPSGEETPSPEPLFNTYGL